MGIQEGLVFPFQPHRLCLRQAEAQGIATPKAASNEEAFKNWTPPVDIQPAPEDSTDVVAPCPPTPRLGSNEFSAFGGSHNTSAPGGKQNHSDFGAGQGNSGFGSTQDGSAFNGLGIFADDASEKRGRERAKSDAKHVRPLKSGTPLPKQVGFSLYVKSIRSSADMCIAYYQGRSWHAEQTLNIPVQEPAPTLAEMTLSRSICLQYDIKSLPLQS